MAFYIHHELIEREHISYKEHSEFELFVAYRRMEYSRAVFFDLVSHIGAIKFFLIRDAGSEINYIVSYICSETIWICGGIIDF